MDGFKQRRHSRHTADLAIQVGALLGTRVDAGTGHVLDISEGGLYSSAPAIFRRAPM